MNHDATHCSNWTKACPKKCYRAELTEDYYSSQYFLRGIPISWAYFKGTKECPKWPNPIKGDNK